jgi:transcriptional regulator with XRE-family HTH domain
MGKQPDRRNAVAAALRAARKARGLTQEEVAARVGCSVNAVSNAERGLTLPALDLFLDLVALLDVDLGVLVDAPKPLNSKARQALEAEVREQVRALGDDKLRLWLGIGKLLAEQ